MSIKGIGSVDQVTPALDRLQGQKSKAAGNGFGDMLGELIKDANEASVKSDQLVESLAKGEPTDVHSVMLAMSEADLSFRMIVEVRNRLIEAYQEIQRMPV